MLKYLKRRFLNSSREVKKTSRKAQKQFRYHDRSVFRVSYLRAYDYIEIAGSFCVAKRSCIRKRI